MQRETEKYTHFLYTGHPSQGICASCHGVLTGYWTPCSSRPNLRQAKLAMYVMMYCLTDPTPLPRSIFHPSLSELSRFRRLDHRLCKPAGISAFQETWAHVDLWQRGTKNSQPDRSTRARHKKKKNQKKLGRANKNSLKHRSRREPALRRSVAHGRFGHRLSTAPCRAPSTRSSSHLVHVSFLTNYVLRRFRDVDFRNEAETGNLICWGPVQ
jgi:hypothetical protein